MRIDAIYRVALAEHSILSGIVPQISPAEGAKHLANVCCFVGPNVPKGGSQCPAPAATV